MKTVFFQGSCPQTACLQSTIPVQFLKVLFWFAKAQTRDKLCHARSAGLRADSGATITLFTERPLLFIPALKFIFLTTNEHEYTRIS
ncbi:MAG: hypothetical protein CR997_13175 [Acidobacteria bacterium]|nr:MAG: hypothetical protein CR997_13175 [Acidobacteriota bacterium]